MISGARRLDRCVERKQVGLVGNLRDGARDIADLACALLKLGDDRNGACLPLRIARDGLGGQADEG